MRFVEKYNDTTYSWEPAPRYIDLDPETANELDKMIDAFEDEPGHALYRSLDSGDYRIYELPDVIEIGEHHDPWSRYYQQPHPTTQDIIETEILESEIRQLMLNRSADDAIYYLAGRAPNMPIGEAIRVIMDIRRDMR